MRSPCLIVTIGLAALMLAAAPQGAVAKDPIGAGQIKRQRESEKAARSDEANEAQRDALRGKLRKLQKMRSAEAQYSGDVHELDSTIEDVKDELNRDGRDLED